MDRFAKYTALSAALRGAVCELELVTSLRLMDGTSTELTHLRRAVCKKATRRGNRTVLTFADVDLAALERVFPFETFTVGDFAELYVEHVGRPITQGIGTVRRVPLTWVKKTGGTWRYAGPKVLPATVPTAPLAVYRGMQPGQGALVAGSEYTNGALAGTATGVVVNTVDFTREQIDFNGRPYVLEADYLLPSVSRTPAEELRRILTLYGITVDTASFDAAVTADTATGFLIDALYGNDKDGRRGDAILADLLQAARAWLTPGTDGSWVLVQDVARASVAEFDTQADQIEIEEYGDGDIAKSITLDYRPRASGGEDYSGRLSRTTVGASGEMRFANPYIQEHVVADKFLSYWQKRLNSLRMASGTMYAVQRGNGDRISITDYNHWTGVKDFIIGGIARPADANRVALREYDASIYTYTAGALPADATNGYSPDYSFTPPAAPTGPTVVSQGTSADTDGKVTAYALIRAVPPSVNWARLMIQAKDTTTNEIYQAQLLLNAGNYEAVVSGLRPNRAHQVIAWAVNASGIDGAATSPTAFTSANATTALSAPSCAASQKQSFEVQIDLGLVSNVAGQPGFYRNILFEKVGGGSFTEVIRSHERVITRQVSHGTTYQYKARSEDMNHNESGDSSTATITPATVIDDSYIIGQGISGGSIADGSINRARGYTSTGSASGSISASSTVNIGMDLYTFSPNVSASLGSTMVAPNALTSDDTGFFGLLAGPGGDSYTVRWRNFLA